MPNRKDEWVRNAPTAVLTNILSTLRGPELEEPSELFPLGGQVHLEGLGWLKVSALRTELERRGEEVEGE